MEENKSIYLRGVGSNQYGDKSPVQRILLNHSSKNGSAHGSIKKGSRVNSLASTEKDESSTEIPQVHASPKKSNATK